MENGQLKPQQLAVPVTLKESLPAMVRDLFLHFQVK
jgi:hypothetical protein